MSIQDYSGSVNSLIVDRGRHIQYVQSAWDEALRRQFGITHSYPRAGLKLNVIAMCGEVDFSSQTKENCVKLDGLTITEVQDYLVKEFIKIFKKNPEYFEVHISRLNEYVSSLTQISTINKIKSMEM